MKFFSAKSVAVLFACLSLLTWQLEWKTSPLNRAIDWAQLRYASTLPATTVLKYGQIVIGESEATPERVASQLLKYGIPTEITTQEEKEVEIPYAKTSKEDSLFLKDATYSSPAGETGTAIQVTKNITINNKSAGTITLIQETKKAAIDQIDYHGTLTKEILTQQILKQ